MAVVVTVVVVVVGLVLMCDAVTVQGYGRRVAGRVFGEEDIGEGRRRGMIAMGLWRLEFGVLMLND